MPEPAANIEEDLARLLVQSVADYAIFMLDPTGKVASWNLGAHRLKGYTADEIIGQHFSRFYPESDIQDGKPARELEIAMRDGRVEDEGWRLRKDGSRFWANVVITALYGEEGDLRGFGKVTRDLTARKAAEDALHESLRLERQLAGRLRALDQMKTEFVGIVAHDLKTPMTVVSGFSNILLDNWDDFPDDRKKDLIKRISNAMKSLTNLVNDILDASRIESGELSLDLAPIDLAGLVDRVAGEATPPETPERIQVDCAEGLPQVLADERRTWQILMNLLSNAVKFSEDVVHLRASLEGDEVMLSVEDRGPGIPETDQDQLFQRFTRLPQTTGSSVKGSGLGLYIAKSMAELQGGRIWVESVPGRGSTFCFTLPIATTSA